MKRSTPLRAGHRAASILAGLATWIGLLTACPLPAHAVWGPFGGVMRLESDEQTAGTFDGFEGGVIAFGPDGEGFWQAAFTRLDQTEGPGRITRAGARLNFSFLSGSAGSFYGGPGGGRNWVSDGTETRTHWSYGAQAGLLITPLEIWRKIPLLGSGNRRESRRVGAASGSLVLGAEIGWTQSPKLLQGFEYRGFVTLLY